MRMITVEAITACLNQLAPPALAEEWDNVGLLLGDPAAPVARVMTCLTVTPASVTEAVGRRAELVVTHHPVLLRPLRQITTATPAGRDLLELAAARIGVYSAHTAFDSASDGINQQLAASLDLSDIAPLVEQPGAGPPLGAGRHGRLPAETTVQLVAERLKEFLGVPALRVVGDPQRHIRQLAVACGSGGGFLEAAVAAGCELLVTGEAKFHSCLAAQAEGLALLLTGHFASERFAMERLARTLAGRFPELEVWASKHETDPLITV